jgi:hypothetical protein
MALFWTGMFIADILAAFLAFGLLHMGGVRVSFWALPHIMTRRLTIAKGPIWVEVALPC